MRVVEALAEVAGALLAAPVDLLLLLLIFSTFSERIKDVEDGYFCSVRILRCYNLFDTRTNRMTKTYNVFALERCLYV